MAGRARSSSTSLPIRLSRPTSLRPSPRSGTACSASSGPGWPTCPNIARSNENGRVARSRRGRFSVSTGRQRIEPLPPSSSDPYADADRVGGLVVVHEVVHVGEAGKIGRASCRERGGQTVLNTVGGGLIKK